jgi:cold shock CspA family protein
VRRLEITYAAPAWWQRRPSARPGVRIFLTKDTDYRGRREIYFHRNSVLDGAFAQLEAGSEVRFAEETGEKGPQASSVSLAGR